MISIPTMLSLLRIALVPLFVYWFLQGSIFAALVVFTIAALSDAYDGYIARKYDMTSQMGAFIDPLADKILMGAALACFVFKGFAPWWVFVVIVGRDVLVTWLRIRAQRLGSVLVTTRLAQYKTAAQMVMIYLAFVWLFIHGGYASWLNYPAILVFIKALFYGVVTLTAYTGIDYVVRYLRLVRKIKGRTC
jgi:CDP-diacylglycerol---glycerol-3-phosphate 3-phosphatidyltransferase